MPSRIGIGALAAPPKFGITDNFERASLGANWDVLFGGAQVQILGSSDLGMVAGANRFFLVNWVGNDFNDDQYSEAVISSEQPTSPIWQNAPYVRRRASDAARYQFSYDNDPQLQYQRWTFKYDGVATEFTRYFAVSDVDTVNVPAPGDGLRIEVRGYDFRGLWKPAATGIWQLMLTATDTDASKIASGRPGLAARDASGNGTLAADTKVWESFGAGNL